MARDGNEPGEHSAAIGGSSAGHHAQGDRTDDRVSRTALWADLRRSRQAALGEPHPAAVQFAQALARAVNPGPDRPTAASSEQRSTEPDSPRAEPDERVEAESRQVDTVASDPPERVVDPAGSESTPDGAGPEPVDAAPASGLGFAAGDPVPEPEPAGLATDPDAVPLPQAPTLLVDAGGRIVRVTAAVLRLLDSDQRSGPGLLGRPLTELLTETGGDDAPDGTTEGLLRRADGTTVAVRVVRWETGDLTAVLVLPVDETRSEVDHRADSHWVTALERMARVGTWSYDIRSATLQRSGSLVELYRAAGIDPDNTGRGGSGQLEGEQVAVLCQRLRTGQHPGEHHVELRLPGDRLLSCRADVETDGDGAPRRIVGVVRDLTEQHRAGQCIRRAMRRFADLMTLAPVGIALMDPAGRVIDANPALCALLDVPIERLRGTPAAVMWAQELTYGAPVPGPMPSPDGAAPLPWWLRPVPVGIEHRYRVDSVPLRRRDGSSVWCELHVCTLPADDGRWMFLVACRDVTEQRRAAQALRTAGILDDLTRLPNRAATIALVDRLLAGPARHRVAVVCGDLDDFRRVNSSLGHDAGDDLLVSLAGRLQRELPVGCTAARLGADEFVVICADHTEVGGPDALARIVADLLRITITVHGRPVQLTASVGLATPAQDGEVRGADLLRFAEAAMHDAKRRERRGGIGVATDGVVNDAIRVLELEAELQAAIATDGLMLEYQPVVGHDGVVLSAEALVRWPHPERGLIPPSEFLPVAQRSGLLRELDLWVLQTACREAAEWPSHCGHDTSVAVNLAGLLPADPDFVAAVSKAVEDSGLAWHRLVLELVETSLVALPPDALAAMAELVERGVRFAVDDFGTGHSSLARFKQLPAQIVKLDRAFVSGVGEDLADFAVTRAVVEMAGAMGRTTVAEGVETAEQFRVLRGIGVNAFQGWLFSRPLAPRTLRALLAGERIVMPPAPG